MRQTRVNSTLRYGLPAALVNVALLGVDQAMRALGPAAIQSPPGRRALTAAFFSCVALVTLATGYFIARKTGRLRATTSTGALAVGLPAALLAVVMSVRTVLAHSDQFMASAVAVIFFTIVAALAGAILAALGGLVGRILYRSAHPEEHAELAAQLAAARATARQRRRSERLGVFGWLMVAAIIVVTMAPMGISYWASYALTRWEGLAGSVGALVIGYGLMRLANNTRWQSYLYDLVGLILISSGVIVGVAEITGYAISLLVGIGTFAFIWRAIDRSMDIRKPIPTEPPELPPVFFRDDGESIVVYPSRRKLAGYAAFAGSVSLIFGALAFVFRSADPTIVFGLGVFAVMGLIGFIPDLARLLHRWPTVTVTSDGIIDRGSGLITGFGLIPWHEIEGVVGGIRLKRNAIPELFIIPVNFERLIARQPLLKRPLLRLGSAMRGGCIAISSLYLAQPTEEVAERISVFVRSHAPASYLESADDADNEPEPPPNAD